MKARKTVFIAVHVLYGLLVLLFILNFFQILEAKGDRLKWYLHLGTIVITPIVVVVHLVVSKTRKWEVLPWISPLIFTTFLCLAVSNVGFSGYLFSMGTYHTQTILYKNADYSFKTIEFQMKDSGALGYSRRTVEVTYLTPWFMITKPVDSDKDPGLGWVKTDLAVDELNIGY